MRCIRCHRPMKIASASGMGRVCTAKAGITIPTVERDLFGYSISRACEAARERVRVHIEIAAIEALMAIRHGFRSARLRCEVTK